MIESDSFLQSFRRVLVLCPHTDDEFACGGTISRLTRSGIEVHYVAFSRCEESVPAGYAVDVLENECRSCTQRLGIDPERVSVKNFRVRHFPAQRQEILEVMVQWRRQLEPDLVLTPTSADTHQDHATISSESFRAFKHSTVLGYELPQNLISFANTAFVRLSEEDIETKVEALGSYQSQTFRPYATTDFMRGLASVRGAQCNSRFAEAFEVMRLIL